MWVLFLEKKCKKQFWLKICWEGKLWPLSIKRRPQFAKLHNQQDSGKFLLASLSFLASGRAMLD